MQPLSRKNAVKGSRSQGRASAPGSGSPHPHPHPKVLRGTFSWVLSHLTALDWVFDRYVREHTPVPAQHLPIQTTPRCCLSTLGVPLSSSSCGPNHPGNLNPEDVLVVGAGASWRSFMEKVAMHWTQRWRIPLCTELATACSPPQLSRTFQGGFWASQSQSPNCRQQPQGHSSLETRPEKETVT